MCTKKIFMIPLIFLLVVVLSACATSQATPQLIIDSNTTTTPMAAQANGTPASDQNGGPGGGQNGGLTFRLAYGTLKLEGTSNAVTVAQAKTLLPLWQKVSDLSSNGTPTPQDIQTVYSQIIAAMTSDQITAIQQMSMTQQDFTSLMQTLGITVTPGPGGGGFGFGNGGQSNNGTLTPEQQATRTARQTQFAGSGGNGNGGFSGTRTPGANGFGGRGGGGFGGSRMNMMFIQPLIKILTTRAAS